MHAIDGLTFLFFSLGGLASFSGSIVLLRDSLHAKLLLSGLFLDGITSSSLGVFDLSLKLFLGGLHLLILGIELLSDLLCNSGLLFALSLDLFSLDFGGLSFLMCDFFLMLSLSMGLSLVTLLFCLFLQAMISGLGGGAALSCLSSGVGSSCGIGLGGSLSLGLGSGSCISSSSSVSGG